MVLETELPVIPPAPPLPPELEDTLDAPPAPPAPPPPLLHVTAERPIATTAAGRTHAPPLDARSDAPQDGHCVSVTLAWQAHLGQTASSRRGGMAGIIVHAAALSQPESRDARRSSWKGGRATRRDA
jgi:hypothetical protein